VAAAAVHAPVAPRSALQWGLLACGVVLLALLVYGAGPRRLLEHVRALGWWAPVIFVPYAVASAFDAMTRTLGPVDILINNAGATLSPTLARTTPGSFEEDVNANLNGAFNCAHAVVPAMKERRAGVIVNIGSVNGLSAFGDPAYSAAKAGLISLTRSLAMELGPYNIRANIICPGTVRTPIWRERLERRPELLKELERWYPLGRIVEPIEVARAVAFLASDAASAITGVMLPVDCGLMAGNIVMTREVIAEDI